MSINSLNLNTFEKEISSAKQPVICFFWTAYCSACNQMSVAISNLERRLGDSAKFCTINLEEYPKISDHAGVIVVPTIIIYKNGRAVTRIFGLTGEEELGYTIEEMIVA